LLVDPNASIGALADLCSPAAATLGFLIPTYLEFVAEQLLQAT
jgi:hypothetical protein